MKLRDEKIWVRPWFRRLPPRLKCLFDYIVDHSDDVGLWIPDFELASIFIGEEVSEKDLDSLEGLKPIEVGSKLFFPDHVLFQWKIESFEDLNPRDKFHVSIVRKMRKISELREYVENFEDPRERNFSETQSESKKETPAKAAKAKETQEERKVRLKKEFEKEVDSQKENFPEMEKADFEAFVDYWTESSKKAKLLLFEKQKTFDVGLRLKRWSKNKETNFGRGQTGAGSDSRKSHGQKVSKKVRDGMSLAADIKAGKIKIVNGKPVRSDQVQEAEVVE